MTATTPRQRKTPKQRAEETLAVAQRRFDRLSDAVDHQRGLLQIYQAELADAEQRLDYATKDPALGSTTSSTTNPAGDTTA